MSNLTTHAHLFMSYLCHVIGSCKILSALLVGDWSENINNYVLVRDIYKNKGPRCYYQITNISHMSRSVDCWQTLSLCLSLESTSECEDRLKASAKQTERVEREREMETTSSVKKLGSEGSGSDTSSGGGNSRHDGGVGGGRNVGDKEKGYFEYFGWVYHLGTNSIGHEYCHLRFLFIRGKYVEMYKRDPHENPGIVRFFEFFKWFFALNCVFFVLE